MKEDRSHCCFFSQVAGYTYTDEKSKEPKRCWRIRGYDSLTLIFDESVPTGQLTEGNMKELLRALVAKHLLPNDLIGAYARRGTKIHNRSLEIQRENQPEKRRTCYTCGDNPYYTADVELCD
jgi:hypothetical protein